MTELSEQTKEAYGLALAGGQLWKGNDTIHIVTGAANRNITPELGSEHTF